MPRTAGAARHGTGPGHALDAAAEPAHRPALGTRQLRAHVSARDIHIGSGGASGWNGRCIATNPTAAYSAVREPARCAASRVGGRIARIGASAEARTELRFTPPCHHHQARQFGAGGAAQRLRPAPAGSRAVLWSGLSGTVRMLFFQNHQRDSTEDRHGRQ